MKLTIPLAGVSATALIATLVPVQALAAPSVTVSSEAGSGQTCPAVQLVLINSKADSEAKNDANTDAGFFAGVSNTAMTANKGEVSDKSAGFANTVNKSEPTATSSEKSTGTSSNDLWGSTESASPKPATKGDSLWGGATETSAAQAAATSERISNPAASASDSSSTTTSPVTATGTNTSSSSSKAQTKQASNKKQNVGRVYINFDDAGGGIPGVTSKDSGDYGESVSAAVDKTNSVLADINSRCPETQVILMGYSEGAQVANAVSKEIGSGKSEFPADKVAGVALFSDPSRSESQPLVANGANAPAAAPGTSGNNLAEATKSLSGAETSSVAPSGAGIATLSDQAGKSNSQGGLLGGAGLGDFGALANRVMSFCIDGDSTCAIPEGSPLRALISTGMKSVDLNDPQKSLMAVADTFGPAVMLGGVESLADDLSFGPQGFQLARAETTDKTMIGRMAAETDRPHDIGEMGQRLMQSGLKLGGMAMAAGVTFAKDVITPTNLAQIAAAGAADPFAAIPVVATKLAAAALNIVTPATATGVALRVFDEVKAAGLGDSQLAEVATQAATWKSVGSGAYKSTPVTSDGQSPTMLAANWARASAGDASGTQLPTISEAVSGLGSVATSMTGLAAGAGGGVPSFDAGAISSALSLIGG